MSNVVLQKEYIIATIVGDKGTRESEGNTKRAGGAYTVMSPAKLGHSCTTSFRLLHKLASISGKAASAQDHPFSSCSRHPCSILLIVRIESYPSVIEPREASPHLSNLEHLHTTSAMTLYVLALSRLPKI